MRCDVIRLHVTEQRQQQQQQQLNHTCDLQFIARCRPEPLRDVATLVQMSYTLLDHVPSAFEAL